MCRDPQAQGDTACDTRDPLLSPTLRAQQAAPAFHRGRQGASLATGRSRTHPADPELPRLTGRWLQVVFSRGKQHLLLQPQQIPAQRISAPAGSLPKSRTWTPSAVVRGVGHLQLRRCRQDRARQCLHRQGLLLQGPHTTVQQPAAHETISSGCSWGAPAGACLGLCSRVPQPWGTWPSTHHSPSPPEPIAQTLLPLSLFLQKIPGTSLAIFTEESIIAKCCLGAISACRTSTNDFELMKETTRVINVQGLSPQKCPPTCLMSLGWHS